MEICIGLHSISQLPDMKAGGTPKYVLATHYGGKDSLLLPPILAPSTLKPMLRKDTDACDNECPCLSFSNDSSVRMSFSPEEILDGMGLHAKIDSIKSPMNIHPATIDTICTRLINMHLGLDLLVLVPASSVSLLAPKKATSSGKGQQAEETDLLCIPVSHTRIDTSEHIIKALSTAGPLSFLHSTTFVLKNSLLGLFGDVLVGGSDITGDFIVDVCVSVTVTMSDFILRKMLSSTRSTGVLDARSKDVTIGTFQFHAINFHGLYNIPGANWTMEFAIPIEADDDGTVRSAIYCTCGGGRVKQAPSTSLTQPVTQTTKKDQSDLTSEQALEKFERLAAGVMAYMPVNTDLSLSKSNFSGAFSTGRTDITSKHTASSHGVLRDRGKSLTYRLTMDLQEYLLVRDIAGSSDTAAQLIFPDHIAMRQHENLVEYALYVEEILNNYSASISRRVEEYVASNLTTMLVDDTRAPRPQSKGTGSSRDTAGSSTRSQGASVRFVAEIFEPFLLGARNLLMSRTVLICMNSKTRSLLKQNHSGKKSNEFMLQILLRPSYSLQAKYLLASKAILSEKKPPAAPLVPIANTHSIFAGNASGMTAFCAQTNLSYGFNRSIIYYTQASDQQYNKFPCLRPQLQQTRQAFAEPLAAYCYACINASSILSPVCQYASCDSVHPLLPYDEAIFSTFFPPVVSSWTGIAGQVGIEEDEFETLYDNSVCSEDASDAASVGRSRPTSAGMDAPIQLRGKANRQSQGSNVVGSVSANTSMKTAGASDKTVKQTAQNPLLAEFIGKAARYSNGNPNYIFGNILCGIYSLLETLSGASPSLVPVQSPSLESLYIINLINKYCNDMLNMAVVLETLADLQKIVTMPAVFNDSLQSTLSFPLIGASIGFQYPLLANVQIAQSARILTSGAVSESGDSIWPASLRLAKHKHTRHGTDPSTRLDSSDAGLEGSDDAHQSRAHLSKRDKQHILSYMDTYSMAKERQKTMTNIRRLVDSWRDDITARYKQVCKPLKTEATQQGRTAISYSDIPEENAKMNAIIQAGRQLALRGLQGQILTQNALVTPAILPQISALLTEEKSEITNDYSIKNFKLLIQNEGFVEILSRRILLQLESLAHKGFNNIDDMMEYLLINIVDGESLDIDKDLEKPRVKGYKIQRRIDKDDDDGLSALISSGPRLQNTDRKISLSLNQPPRKSETNRHDSSVLTSDRVRVVGDSISVLFPDVDDEERERVSTAITNQSTISQDTSYLDGMNSLVIPQHVSLKDINSYLFKAKFLSILGMDDCLELSFKLASATLARQGQLLSNDRKINIFDTTNIARISKLVSRSNFQIMVSTMLITGTRLSSPHIVRTATDFERLATYMRGPVGVICACLNSEQSMQLLGTDSCLLALTITKTLFKSAIGTSDTSQKKQGKRGKIVVPLGYDYSEQLLVSALLAYDNFMKYLISKVAGYNVEEVHVWTKNDTQSTVATKLRERKYNKEDVDSMMEILKITPIRNYYSKQFNDLLEGEANTNVVKLPKDAAKITAFPSNESVAGSIAGSVAISLYDRQAKRIGDDVSEVGSTLRRNAAGMSATTSVMSGLSGLANEKKAKIISPELQAELDAMPFHNVPGNGAYAYPPFWAMGAYIFILWSMKLMDARHIARALQTSFRKYIELKQEQYKDDVYFQEHGKHRKTIKDFADDSIGSDIDSGKSCDTTISVDADLVAGVSPSGNNLSCNTTSMNIHGANDVHHSPSLSRLSFEDLKNYKSLKMQKSNYTKQVSINHYSAIQEYLKSDTLDGGMFAPLPYRFKSNAEFMEYVLDSTLPENDKFANPNDPASKNIMRLCAFLSLAEWLSLRGETIISTYATSLADHILKAMIASGAAAPDSPFFLHQQLRGIIISMRNMLYERRYAPALEFADSVLRGSLGPSLIPKVKACPAFLYLRARVITNMNISLLMKAYDPTNIQTSGQLEQSSQYSLSTMLSNDSTRALLNETSRMAIQAYQLASRSKQGGRDDFFRGSTSTYDSYLPAEFLYTIALILFSSINIVGVIRSIFASASAKPRETSSEEVKQKVDLMFTEVPKYQNTRFNAIDEDDRDMDTLNDFTSLLPLPKPTYSRQPYDITSDATSTQMMYMREQYNANKLIKVQQLKDSKEPVKMSIDLLKELKARAKEVVVDAGGDTELLASDSRNNSPGHGVVTSSANIASMMQQKIQDTTTVDFDNTIAALASATITNRTLTPERTQKDVSRALILASSALKNLILKYPHLGQAWASFSLTQLAMGNVVESRLSSSIATLLAPEAIESWVSWVCCELQEIHGIKSSNGTVNQSRIAEVRNYMRQIEAMGVLYTMLRVVWVDICQFASELLFVRVSAPWTDRQGAARRPGGKPGATQWCGWALPRELRGEAVGLCRRHAGPVCSVSEPRSPGRRRRLAGWPRERAPLKCVLLRPTPRQRRRPQCSGDFSFAGAVLQLARAVCEADGSGGAGSCKTCGVTIGGSEYCGECNDGTNYAPVDGVCADAGQAPASTFCPQHDAGKCTQCESTSFKYKDGCYQPNDGKPGQTLCLMASGGVCTEAAPGYFVPTGAVNTEQSVIACGDTTGVAIAAGGSTQKGVADCAECSAPDAAPGARADKVATCTKCGAGKYLKDNGCIDKAQCDPGSTNRFVAVDDPENGNRCVSCNDNPNGGVANCDTCAYDEQSKRIRCTKCSGNKYLKTTTDGITTCVEQNACTPDSFPVEDTQNGNKCVSCSDANNGGIDKCTACAPIGTGRAAIAVTCTACAAGYKPSADKTTCEAVTNCKTPECQTCNNEGKESEVCTECASGAYLTPTSQCIDSCDKLGNYYGATEGAKQTCKECAVPNCKTCNNQGQCQICKDGSYKNGDTCSPCHESCKTCTAGTANDCTACPTGRALKYGGDGAKGTCDDGCTTGQGSGACKTCGLTIDGASYCSECAVDTEYPQNGVCAPKANRATPTCSDSPIQNGVCGTCANNYFKMNGGCYEIAKYPGKAVCTATQAGGTCKTAADGYKLDSGTLTVCSEGCKECASGTECTTCMDRYVKSTKICTKCDPSCETCNGAATTCKACATGYYKTASGEGVCTSCESDSNGVAGVKGCMNCAPPSSSTGPVLCYLMKDDSTGGSTNRGGLSTGAIAGIAVAVVVVVGGLVGFLCWWFLCRGKA